MSQETAEMNASSGYKGEFGKVSVWDFFQQKDWYEKMFLRGGGMLNSEPYLNTLMILQFNWLDG